MFSGTQTVRHGIFLLLMLLVTLSSSVELLGTSESREDVVEDWDLRRFLEINGIPATKLLSLDGRRGWCMGTMLSVYFMLSRVIGVKF